MSENAQFSAEALVPASLELLGHLNRFYAGKENYDDFIDSIENARRAIPKVISEFLPSLPISDNPSISEHQRGSVNILTAATNDLSTVIPQIIEFSDDPSEELYMALVERLGRICEVERIAIEQYRQAESVVGPTDMPFVNSVYHAQKSFFSGKISEQSYLQAIDRVIAKLEDARKEIADKSDESEAKSDLMYSYDKFIRTLEHLKSAIPEGESSSQSLMADVEEAARFVRDSLKIYTFHSNTSGPTRMIQANLIINMAQSWQSGRIDSSVISRAIDIFVENLDRSWRQVQALASLPTDTDEIAEIMVPLREAYEGQFQAVNLFRQGIAGNSEALEQAYEVMSTSANLAADCRERFLAMGENIGKVPCMRCGAYNPAGSRSCEKCGARIVVSGAMDLDFSSTISYQESGGSANINGDMIITPQLEALFKAVNNMAEGRISAEEYFSAIDTYRNFLEKTYDVERVSEGLLKESEDPNGDLPQRVDEVCGELYNAVQGVLEGLESLRQYGEGLDARDVYHGATALRDSVIKLQKAVNKVKLIKEGAPVEEENEAYANYGEFPADSELSAGFVG